MADPKSMRLRAAKRRGRAGIGEIGGRAVSPREIGVIANFPEKKVPKSPPRIAEVGVPVAGHNWKIKIFVLRARGAPLISRNCLPRRFLKGVLIY
jgi:hypothetical protein